MTLTPAASDRPTRRAAPVSPVTLPADLRFLGGVVVEWHARHYLHVRVEHRPTGLRGWASGGDVASAVRGGSYTPFLRWLRTYPQLRSLAAVSGGLERMPRPARR